MEFDYLLRNPIPSQGKVCLVEDESTLHEYAVDRHVGELYDVFCVVMKTKHVAALDLSAYGIRKIKKHWNQPLVTKVLGFCRSNENLKVLHKKDHFSYLKSIVYLEEHEHEAKKLASLLWSPCFHGRSFFHFATGYLLGYKIENIKHFLKMNLDHDLGQEEENDFMAKIHDYEINLPSTMTMKSFHELKF